MRDTCRALMVAPTTRVFPGVPPHPAPPVRLARVNASITQQVAFSCGPEGSLANYDRPEARVVASWVDECGRVQLLPETALSLVRPVPVELPVYPESAGPYESPTPGLVPDRLEPLSEFGVRVLPDYWQAIHVSAPAPSEPGRWQLCVQLTDRRTSEELARATQVWDLRQPGPLPRSFRHSEWLHLDCLAHAFTAPVGSPAHWLAIDEALAVLRRAGADTLFTPIVNPPIDQDPQHPRTCVQLVDITPVGASYDIGLDRLDRYAALARSHGFTALEFAHLFTQSGAEGPADIRATDGTLLFGAGAPTDMGDYRRLLEVLLPRLLTWIDESGWKGKVLWHLSDEPFRQHRESYLQARAMVDRSLGEVRFIDAVDDLGFAQHLDIPVSIVNSVDRFIDAGVDPLWIYTSCASTDRVPNRHLAMPLGRMRILGVLMYVHGIEGYLHWGFNFWSSQYSRYPIDPRTSTDSGFGFPGGDAFVVYPGSGTRLQESLRLHELAGMHEDVALLRAVEQQSGREVALSMISAAAQREATSLGWTDYPTHPAFFEAVQAACLRHLDPSTPTSWTMPVEGAASRG